MKTKTPVAGATAGRISNDDRLHRFGQCGAVLRDVLDDDRAIDVEDFFFIDKHFQILQLAYLRWKRKHRPTDDVVPLM